MPIRVTATEAKARMLRLLDDAEAGEEIEISRHGRIVARLVPATGAHALEGCMAGVARTVDPEDELFSTGDRWDAF